jgi:hypothetical protein
MEPTDAPGPPPGAVPLGCNGVLRPDGAFGGFAELNPVFGEFLSRAGGAEAF